MKKQGLPYESAEDGLQALNKYTENPGRYFLILCVERGVQPNLVV